MSTSETKVSRPPDRTATAPGGDPATEAPDADQTTVTTAGTGPDAESPATDGRTARALRTRDALVDATMALIEGGDLRPTAPRIAERAGVSVRSVFQHFDDLESLFSALGDRVFARVAAIGERIDRDLPLEERVDRFIRQRCAINELVTPINRAAVLFAPTSSTINRQFQHGHRLASSSVADTFAPEVVAAGTDGDVLLDGLTVATAWSTWNMLRLLDRRPVAEAEIVVARMVRLVLVGAGALER